MVALLLLCASAITQNAARLLATPLLCTLPGGTHMHSIYFYQHKKVDESKLPLMKCFLTNTVVSQDPGTSVNIESGYTI